jgi:hypothetical protein
MNIFGAFTVMVVITGALVGAKIAAHFLRANQFTFSWLIVCVSGLVSGYLSLKLYFEILRKLDNRSRGKFEKLPNVRKKN